MKYFDIGPKNDVYLHVEEEESKFSSGINIILFRIFTGPSVTGLKVCL